MNPFIMQTTTRPRPSRWAVPRSRGLRAVAHGFTSSKIGRRLNLSAKTVETYRERIYEKLGVCTRADLVQYAVATGILEEM